MSTCIANFDRFVNLLAADHSGLIKRQPPHQRTLRLACSLQWSQSLHMTQIGDDSPLSKRGSVIDDKQTNS